MFKSFSSEKYKRHEEFMKKILAEIFSSPIAPYVAFKGGTLAYFCYELDRYSTDIDIDILDITKEQEILDEVSYLLDNLGDVKSLLVGKYLHRWKFRYDLQSTNIKVELNKRISECNTYEMRDIHGVQVQCMDQISMVTNKLIALSARYYNRDLYDTHFFLSKKYVYNEEIVKERTGKNIQTLIHEIIEELPARYPDNEILAGMGDVLTDKQKSRVKSHLLQETIDLLTFYLQHH